MSPQKTVEAINAQLSERVIWSILVDQSTDELRALRKAIDDDLLGLARATYTHPKALVALGFNIDEELKDRS